MDDGKLLFRSDRGSVYKVFVDAVSIGWLMYSIQFHKVAEASSGWIVSGVVDQSSLPPCQSFCVNVYMDIHVGSNMFLYFCLKASPTSKEQWTYNEQTLSLSTQAGTSGEVLCMEGSEAGKADVILAECNNITSQKWTFESGSNRLCNGGDPATPLYLHAISPPNSNFSDQPWSTFQLFVDNNTGGSETVSQFTMIPMSATQNIPALPLNNASNLIRNGGFDSLTLPYQNVSIPSKFLYLICGWIVQSNVNAVPKGCSSTAHGNCSIDLGGVGTITQTVPVYRGSEYLLIFQLSSNNTCSSTVVQVQLQPSSTSQNFNLSGNSLGSWQSQHLAFVASDKFVNLSFISTLGNSSCSPIIDNVELYMVPNQVPGSWSFPSKKHNSTWVLALVLLGWITAGCILLLCAIYVYRGRGKRRPTSQQLADQRADIKALKRYSFEELRRLTRDFTNLIGRGGFASVYRAELPDGALLAVKREFRTAWEGTSADSFAQEIAMLSRVHHRCIVNFLGYCNDEAEHIMVVEFMANGSLYRQLHVDKNPILTWVCRIRIAFQVASGLEYLHHGANPPIVHRDVKSANILLAEDFSAKVADFGISKIGHLNASKVESTLTQPRGSPGYIDPQYNQTFVLSEKSDVYSFGVVLLELISGRKAVQDNETLVKWARKFFEGEEDLQNMVDESLGESVNQEELHSLAEIASMCVMLEGQKRPTMFEVVKLLRERMWVSLQTSVSPLSRATSIATAEATSMSLGTQIVSAR